MEPRIHRRNVPPARRRKPAMIDPMSPRTLYCHKPHPRLTILHARGWAPGVVSLVVGIPVGSWRDALYARGTANLVGEMLLHGPQGMASEAFCDAVESRGASLGVAVGRDQMSFSLQCLAEDADELIALVLDALTRPALDPAKLERERQATAMDLWEDDDQPLVAAAKLFEEQLYGDHPYAWDPLGTLDDLPRVTLERVHDFFQREILPRPWVIAVAGYPDLERLEVMVLERLGDVALSPPPTPPPQATPAAQQLFVARPVDREWMVLGNLAPSLADPDAVPMRALNAILGGAMDCRLFNEVRDRRGLAYQIASSYMPRRGPGVFAVSLGADVANHDRVLACVSAELDQLCQTPVAGDELARAVRYLQGSTTMALESQLGMLAAYASYETCGLGYEYVSRLPELLETVTPEDVLRAARRTLPQPLICVVAPERAPA